jgi:hypothetical protein
MWTETEWHRCDGGEVAQGESLREKSTTLVIHSVNDSLIPSFHCNHGVGNSLSIHDSMGLVLSALWERLRGKEVCTDPRSAASFPLHTC